LTLFEGIKMLPPGHSLTVSRGSKREVVIQQYWDYDFNYENELSESEYVEELRRLFDQAVKRQLISDVEVGSYLSGGIDSGSITCLAAKSFKNLKTFTCGFDLSSASGLELGFDEREKAEFLSNIYKTEHYEVVLKAGDMERIMPELIWHLEDLRVGQSYPNFYISRLASKFVKVVLSGAGGDELFAGYPWRYFRSYGASYEEYMNEYYSYWQRLIPDSLKPQFFVPDIYPQILSHSTLDVFKSVLSPSRFKTQSPTDFINHSLYFEIKTFLPGILLVEDKLSMAHSLETRTPFLDNDLVNFALNIPIKYKLRDNNTKLTVNENDPKKLELGSSNGKLILRKVLSNYVPHHYANGLKQGFSAPDASWFKGESIDYIKSLLFNKRARIYDFIQPQTAQALMNEHFSGKTNRRLLIWSLLCFEWWNRIFDPV
jgi:asparagine synthase (glutamine-hydrolysing)